jgi:hypothetical protein
MMNTEERIRMSFPDLDDPSSIWRLTKIVPFLTHFEDPHFCFGELRIRAGQFPCYETSEKAQEFVQAAYAGGWVLPELDWHDWMRTDEAVALRDSTNALDGATPLQLAKLLTTCIRQDRFVDGALLAAFECGLLTRILRRAAAILGGMQTNA